MFGEVISGRWALPTRFHGDAALPPDVRKGFAFPDRIKFSFWGYAPKREAQPRNSFSEPDGKAKPFRTSGGTAAR